MKQLFIAHTACECLCTTGKDNLHLSIHNSIEKCIKISTPFSTVGGCTWLWPLDIYVQALSDALSGFSVFVPPCWIPDLTYYLHKVTGWWVYLLR